MSTAKPAKLFRDEYGEGAKFTLREYRLLTFRSSYATMVKKQRSEPQILKKLLLILTCMVMLLSCFGCEAPSVDGTGTKSSNQPERPSTKEPTARAIWQDPNNVVVLWSYDVAYEYSIYRSTTPDGSFAYIGNSTLGSYRDATAEYPNTYYYKIEAKHIKTQQVIEFAPVAAELSPEDVDAVSVIMYHNFVSEEDIANGIEFEEYSISPADFEADLIWLKENGYVTITSRELLYYLENKKPIPKNAVILSIDDGSWGVYTNAWPLLKKHGMKADFNVIGAQIDATWETLHEGGTRQGDPAPFCTWEELIEMQQSGEINICSHTYGMHVYNKEQRIGMSMMKNETAEAFAKAVQKDYSLALSCIEGWTGIMTETVAYPYSKRSELGDRIVLENTGYKILMAGDGARGTTGNYFVRGCDFANQLTLMSRPCRMDGTPISAYLARIQSEDANNGVNLPADPT